MTDEAQNRAARFGGVLVAVGLALAVLLVFRPLLLTNRVLATGDAFAYFTPYRDFANQALAAGRLPLWNPYLFLGSPFLANPQSAVFYPLHWFFIGLPAAKSLAASVGLHLWLAGFGTALYVRRVARLSWSAAFVGGLVFMLGGYLGARAGQVNQLSAAAWLPWMLWLLEETWGRGRALAAGPGRVNWIAGAALALVVALQLLAGHTQTAFINLVGLSVAAIWPAVVALLAWLWQRLYHSAPAMERASLAAGGRRFGLLLAAVALGFGLAAVQLLPTLELAGQSIRSGGLTFREVASFSLDPRRLLLSLLPTYRENLPDRFGSPAYGEYVVYVGVAGLLLAGLGLWTGRRASGSGLRLARGLALALAVVGFALALGMYDPLYFLLYKLVPGFDLFRAPARWMLLYTVGVAVLAGYSVDGWFMTSRGPLTGRQVSRPRLRRWQWIALVLVVIGAAGLLALQSWPGLVTLLAWLVVGGLVIGLALVRRGGRWRWAALVALLLVELTFASFALEHTRPTAPEAITSLRTAPADLLAAARDAEQRGEIPGRFLSISGITFDPGDLADLETMFSGELPPEAIYDLVVASKLQEIVAPNLPLLWRLPAVDGYDGGVLPLRRYVDLQALFAPGEALDPDGRLREQLTAVPASRLLRLLNVQHVITDKGFDVWRDGVYYDLELSTHIAPGEAITLTAVDRLEATELGLFSHLEGAAALPDGQRVGMVSVVDGTGERSQFELRAGQETAEGVWTSNAQHGQPANSQPWPRDAIGWDYLARLPLAQPGTPASITVRNVSDTGDLVLRGVTLIDGRTGTHAALTMPADGAFQRVHSGDVKIYENLEKLPRAYLAGGVTVLESDEAALAALAQTDFDPAQTTVLTQSDLEEQGLTNALAGSADGGDVVVTRYLPEDVELRVRTEQPGLLVLADTWYPGWIATVDGVPAPILRANYLFRGVPVPAGEHVVTMRFQPASLRTGLLVTAVAVVGLLLLLLVGLLLRRGKAGKKQVG